MRIARSGDWLTARVGDELVMMSTQRGTYLGLSEVGARVWELLDADADLDRICEALEREFDVAPDVCRAEVETFVDQMAGQGLVTIEIA
jgi:Coenzyme PQQ synthesis protein D (PqqD)